MSKKIKYSLVLFILLFNYGLSKLSAQLKSDLIINNNKILLSDHKMTSDSSILYPSLFKNSEYLLPTAFFCKMELGLDKKSGLPIRFRLGSLDYVNYLEGKDKTGVIEYGGN